METDSTDSTGQIGWEKTVEYSFIAQAAVEGLFDWAAPLAWVAERNAGDVVLKAQDGRYVLVEFKRTAGDFSAELTKFKKPQKEHFGKAAIALLKDYPPCHFAVFLSKETEALNVCNGIGAAQRLIRAARSALDKRPQQPGVQELHEALQVLHDAEVDAEHLTANPSGRAGWGLAAREYFLQKGQKIRPAIDILKAAKPIEKDGAVQLLFSRKRVHVNASLKVIGFDEAQLNPSTNPAYDEWVSNCEELASLQPGLLLSEFQSYLDVLMQYREPHGNASDAIGHASEIVLSIDSSGRIMDSLPLGTFLKISRPNQPYGHNPPAKTAAHRP